MTVGSLPRPVSAGLAPPHEAGFSSLRSSNDNLVTVRAEASTPALVPVSVVGSFHCPRTVAGATVDISTQGGRITVTLQE